MSRTVNRLATLASLIPLATLLCVWEFGVGGSPRGRFLFGAPSLVFRAAVQEFGNSRGCRICGDLLITAGESGLGLVSGTLFGALLGLSLWVNRRLAVLVRPYVIFLGAVPIFAISPMLVIWFGTGLLPKIVMAGFPVFLLVFARVYFGAQGIDSGHREWLDGIGMSRSLALKEVILPESLGVIIEAMRAGVGVSLVGAFIGEFVVSNAGLGFFVLRAGGVYDIPRVLLGVMLFGMLGMLFVSAINWCASLLRL